MNLQQSFNDNFYLLASDISVSWDSNPVLNKVRLQINPGDCIGLIGPSSGGKSVLLKSIAGLLSLESGNVQIGEGVTLSLCFQEGALFDWLTVFENVCFPLVKGKICRNTKTFEATHPEFAKQVHSILSRVGLDWACNKFVQELSGGMRRRVSLARALVTEPKVALLDDPTSGLDPVASSVIMDLVVELKEEQQSSLVMVSHDLRRLVPRCNRIVCLWDGEIIFDGSLAELRESSNKELRHFVNCRYEL